MSVSRSRSLHPITPPLHHSGPSRSPNCVPAPCPRFHSAIPGPEPPPPPAPPPGPPAPWVSGAPSLSEAAERPRGVWQHRTRRWISPGKTLRLGRGRWDVEVFCGLTFLISIFSPQGCHGPPHPAHAAGPAPLRRELQPAAEGPVALCPRQPALPAEVRCPPQQLLRCRPRHPRAGAAECHRFCFRSPQKGTAIAAGCSCRGSGERGKQVPGGVWRGGQDSDAGRDDDTGRDVTTASTLHQLQHQVLHLPQGRHHTLSPCTVRHPWDRPPAVIASLGGCFCTSPSSLPTADFFSPCMFAFFYTNWWFPGRMLWGSSTIISWTQHLSCPSWRSMCSRMTLSSTFVRLRVARLWLCCRLGFVVSGGGCSLSPCVKEG